MVTELQHEIQNYRKEIAKLKSIIVVTYLKSLAQPDLNEEIIEYLEQEINKLDL
jgi:hypothetical protein